MRKSKYITIGEIKKDVPTIMDWTDVGNSVDKREYIVNCPSYFENADILYCPFEDNTLDYTYKLEDTKSDITVYYNEDNSIRGVEIYNFSKYGSAFPIIVDVDCTIIESFKIKIMSINDNFGEKNIENIKEQFNDK